MPNIPPEFVSYDGASDTAVRGEPRGVHTCVYNAVCQFTVYAASYTSSAGSVQSSETVGVVRAPTLSSSDSMEGY